MTSYKACKTYGDGPPVVGSQQARSYDTCGQPDMLEKFGVIGDWQKSRRKARPSTAVHLYCFLIVFDKVAQANGTEHSEGPQSTGGTAWQNPKRYGIMGT